MGIVLAVVFSIFVLIGIGAEICDWLQHRAVAKEKHFGSEFGYALACNPKAVSAVVAFEAEVKATLRKLGQKEITLTFTL